MRNPRSAKPSTASVSHRPCRPESTTDRPFAISFMPTLSMALSRARPIKNSRERSAASQHRYMPQLTIHPEHTIDTLLIRKRVPLLRLVPFNNQTITEGERRAGVSRTGTLISADMAQIIIDQTYNSSQLNSDLASVVSICLTASASNSSFVSKPFADCRGSQAKSASSLLRKLSQGT